MKIIKNSSNGKMLTFTAITATILIFAIIWTFSPSMKKVINSKKYEIKKVNDITNYETIKRVEDTCKSMISSYNADKLIFEQYKDNKEQQEKSWADEAKMRANRTASIYNEFILKNNFVWKNKIPEDIKKNLGIIK